LRLESINRVATGETGDVHSRNGGVRGNAVSEEPGDPDVGKSEQENRCGNDESGLLACTVLHLLGSFSGARAVGGRLGGGRVGGVGCVRRLTHRTIADRDALDRFRLPGSFRCEGFLFRGGWGRFRVVIAPLDFPAQLRFPAQRGCGARGGGSMSGIGSVRRCSGRSEEPLREASPPLTSLALSASSRPLSCAKATAPTPLRYVSSHYPSGRRAVSSVMRR